MSIAALVLAKHERTGLVRAYIYNARGGRPSLRRHGKEGVGRAPVLQRLAPGRAIGGELGPPRAVDVELVERGADAAPKRHVGAPDRPAVRHPR